LGVIAGPFSLRCWGLWPFTGQAVEHR